MSQRLDTFEAVQKYMNDLRKAETRWSPSVWRVSTLVLSEIIKRCDSDYGIERGDDCREDRVCLNSWFKINGEFFNVGYCDRMDEIILREGSTHGRVLTSFNNYDDHKAVIKKFSRIQKEYT